MDIRVIALDETGDWSIPEYARYIERIETVYVFDAGVGVHCCELTPSYELWPIDTRAIMKDETPDNIREAIDETVMAHMDYDVIYVHAGRIHTLIDTLKHERFRYRRMRYRKAPMDDIVQSLRENTPL